MKEKRKLLDENGRIFGVIGVVDILAVLVVLALLVMVYTRFFSESDANVSDSGFTPITYEIKMSQVRDLTVKSIMTGDRLYTTDGEDLGVVTDISAQPAVRLVDGTDGAVHPMEVEDYYDVILTMSVQGSENGGRYYAGRTYELGVNGAVYFTTKYTSSSGKIWSVG